MAPPFRSLIFLGIWKFGLWPGKGELLKLRASACTLLRRSGASCSGINVTLSPHPGWSPFWLAVAEVAAEFFGGSPPSGWRSSVSAHSEFLFPTALGFRAIFGHRARNTGNVALTITAPLHTHTLLLTQPPPLWKWRTRSSPPLQNAAVTMFTYEKIRAPQRRIDVLRQLDVVIGCTLWVNIVEKIVHTFNNTQQEIRIKLWSHECPDWI